MTDNSTPIKELLDQTYKLYKKQAKLDDRQLKSLDSALLKDKKRALSTKRDLYTDDK